MQPLRFSTEAVKTWRKKKRRGGEKGGGVDAATKQKVMQLPNPVSYCCMCADAPVPKKWLVMGRVKLRRTISLSEHNCTYRRLVFV
jgi:hypothetical protein